MRALPLRHSREGGNDRRALAARVAVAVSAAALLVASAEDARAQPAVPAPATEARVAAPTLKTREEAVYPPDALKQRLAATVGIELTVDEAGNVSDAKVTAPAG